MGTRGILIRIAFIAAVVIVVDRAVGRVVTETLGPGASRHAWWLIGDDIGFQYVRNTGAAFGMLQGNPELLGAVSILVAVGFVWLILNEMPRGLWAVLSGGLLLGGAAGNLIGRLYDGYVTDYVAVGTWPRFNLADSAISIGVAIFVVTLLIGVDTERGDDGAGTLQTQHEDHQEGEWQRD